MARIVGINLVLISSALIIFLLSSLIPISLCYKKPAIAMEKDEQFIKCQFCWALSYQLHHQVEEKRARFSPMKIKKHEIIETMEGICNLKNHESDWIPYPDTMKVGNLLKLILQDSEGQCSSKCEEIERACQEVLVYHGTDIAEFIYKRKPKFESLLNFICHDITKSCTFPAPVPVPEDRVIDIEIMALEDMSGRPTQIIIKQKKMVDIKKGKKKSSPTKKNPKTSNLEL